MSIGTNARQRARDEVRAAIVDESRRQVTDQGAEALSLRAVARQDGMVSSAMYRYLANRDEILTLEDARVKFGMTPKQLARCLETLKQQGSVRTATCIMRTAEEQK